MKTPCLETSCQLDHVPLAEYVVLYKPLFGFSFVSPYIVNPPDGPGTGPGPGDGPGRGDGPGPGPGDGRGHVKLAQYLPG